MFAAYEKCSRPAEKCLRPKNGAEEKEKIRNQKLEKTIERLQLPEEWTIEMEIK